MTEIFSGNYPEASLPNDVDDIYLDSLREQAEKMGIMSAIQQNIIQQGGKLIISHINMEPVEGEFSSKSKNSNSIGNANAVPPRNESHSERPQNPTQNRRKKAETQLMKEI